MIDSLATRDYLVVVQRRYLVRTKLLGGNGGGGSEERVLACLRSRRLGTGEFPPPANDIQGHPAGG